MSVLIRHDPMHQVVDFSDQIPKESILGERQKVKFPHLALAYQHDKTTLPLGHKLRA